MRNRFKAMLMLAVVAFGVIGCADKLVDESGGTNGLEGEKGNVYMNVAVAFPTTSSTRSGTDEEGGGTGNNDKTNSDEDKGDDGQADFEYGWAYENDVKTLLLVITNKANNYITHAEVSIAQSPTDQEQGTGNGIKEEFSLIAAQKFSRQAISDAYESEDLLKNNKDVRVYAFCNYTADLLHKFDNITDDEKKGKWLGWSGQVIENNSSIVGSVWSKQSFLMSNAKVFDTKFPNNESDWDNYTTEQTPFHLSGDGSGSNDDDKAYKYPVYVERAAARIDFKDGSNYVVDGKKMPNTYAINTKGTDDDINLVSVQLARMSLVNMSQNYYYLRRVSKDGTATDSIVGGIEGTTNKDVKYDDSDEVNPSKSIRAYVVDTDADSKKKTEGGINTTNAQSHFNFSLFVKPEHQEGEEDANKKDQYNMDNWYTTDIADVLEGQEDTWSGSVGSRYHIWRYVTENTIPSKETDGEDYSQQKTVQSTGVVFKAKILPGEDMTEQVGDEYYVSEKVQAALNASENKLWNKPLTDTDFDKDQHFDYPDLYLYHGTLYAGLEELVDVAVQAGEAQPLHAAVDSVLQYWHWDGNEADKVFKYKKPTTTGSDVATANETEEVQLTVEIFNQILNKEKYSEDAEAPYNDVTYIGFNVDFLKDAESQAEQLAIAKAFAAFKNLITKERGMTIYEPSYDTKENGDAGYGWGYYCYYFYWNRHNDNGKNTIMGPMEFATVRNNVYKLSVSMINQLGHPSTPDDDPDPVEPEDPDEDSKVYLDVKVEVLPWVVRVNDIIF